MARPRTFRRLFSYVRSYRGHLVVSLASLVVYAALSSAMLYLVKPLFSNLFAGSQGAAAASNSGLFLGLRDHLDRLIDGWIGAPTTVGTLERIGLLIVIVTLVKTVFYYINGWALTHMEQGVVKGLRDDLYVKLHDLSLSYFEARRTGHLVSRVTSDVSVVQETLQTTLTQLVREPLLALFYLCLLLALSWPLTLLAIVLVPVAAYVVARLGRALRRYSASTQERMAEMNDILEETLSGMRVVKAFAMAPFEIRKFKAATGAYFRANLDMVRVRLLASPAGEVLGAAMIALVIWVGSRQVYVRGELSAAEFITFLVLMFSLGKPVKSLSDVHIKLQQGLAAADRVFEVLDTPAQVTDLPGARPLSATGAVAFREVSFHYDTGGLVLKDINFEVPPGEVLALVGPSGAGKSTVLDLIPRFYDPTAGAVLLNGQDVRAYTLPSVRDRMGIVTQEVILFNDTVRNNIAYGRQELGYDQVEKAARMANAHEFIISLPQGYDTPIGQHGVLLSGGQRQRLAIARALLKDPEILIFDEATSALDSESERLVQEAIDRLLSHRTVFVVAHRLSTIRHADRIAVLEGGRIVEEGVHAELYQAGGLYRRLYDLQFREEDQAFRAAHA
jgi:ATP-binding cassette, subfamily B, bacterial MsbA